MSELFRALGALAEPPRPPLAPVAAALDLGPLPVASEHTSAFDFALYPFASVYLGPEGMMGGDARDRIAGFFRALGAEAPPEPDHLAVLLSAYAGLAERARHEPDPARRGALARAQKTLFWEHIGVFVPPYVAAMREHHPGFYARWAELLGEAVRGEAVSLGPPDALPRHLAASRPLDEADAATMASLVAAILSPVRSGTILLRADLVRAARDLGLGCRAGERRYVLFALLAQDAPRVLGRLAAEAARWEVRHRAEPAGCVSAEWARRARATATLLSAQSDLARGSSHVAAE